MVTAFFAVSLYGGIVAYDNLAIVTAHAYDLAIFQQAFSSTAQGFHIPFYESTDCVAKFRCSFLIVHPSLVLYPLVPLYFLVPSAFTLFAIRSLIVGAAAVPLYFLARRVTGSTGRGLFAAGLYLLWAPTLGGDLFSFHVESFLPVEFFALVALWEARRYRLAMVVAVVAFVTLEIAPIFTFLIAVFFLLPFVPSVLRTARAAGRSAPGALARSRAWIASLGTSLRAALHHPQARPAFLLAGISLAGYFVLTLFMNVFGAGLLGLPPPLEPGGVSDLAFNNSSGPVYTSVWGALTSSAFLQTIEFWIILYALLGFIPLLAPRALVIGVPWIALTLLSADHRFSGIGSQYTMVAAVPLFIGLAYGLVRVPLGQRDRPDLAPTPGTGAAPPGDSAAVRRARMPKGRRTGLWMALVGAVVLANLLLSPMVPLIPATLGTLPPPFFPDYFEPSLTVEPGIQWLNELVGEIPSRSTVGVANNLFPYVADDIAAYRLTSSSLADLPFNYSGGPEYVLATDSTATQGGSNLTTALGNLTDYGLRGYVELTPVGPIVLFERGFTGFPELFGPTVAPKAFTFEPGHGLNVGRSGVEVNFPGAPGGVAIESNLVRNLAGLVSNATIGFLPPGNYTLDVSVELSRLNASAENHSLGAELRVVGIGTPLLNVSLTGLNLTYSTWTNVTFPVTVRTVSVGEGFQVEWKSLRFSVAVAYASWTPT
jgi:uncharacterized membrane protein